MPDFKRGKIYKLWCHEINDIYIGSTTQSLSQRLSGHKLLDCSSKILFEKSNNVKIELIESYPCKNKMELNRKENEYIRKNDCINKLIANQKQKDYNKKYYEDHKEKVLEKIKEFNIKNKNEIAEKKKEYYEKNKVEIEEKKKEKFTCELCNCKVSKNNIMAHFKSLKHYGAVTAVTAVTGLDDVGTTYTSLDSTDTGCLLEEMKSYDIA